MDGASIHCHPDITRILRGLGIYVVFLPAYTPFFNPIELLFGYIKSYLKRIYRECERKDLEPYIAKAFAHYAKYDFREVFAKCGYTPAGFDAATAFGQDLKKFGFDI
jgi:transposase